MTHENQSPAFPFTEMHTHGTPYTQWKGMTLRDYFAAKAMQALIEIYEPVGDNGCIPDVAASAYEYADAMLKARGK